MEYYQVQQSGEFLSEIRVLIHEKIKLQELFSSIRQLENLNVIPYSQQKLDMNKKKVKGKFLSKINKSV